MKKITTLAFAGLIVAAGLLPASVYAQDADPIAEFEVTHGRAVFSDRSAGLDELRRMSRPPFKMAGKHHTPNLEVPNQLRPDHLANRRGEDVPRRQLPSRSIYHTPPYILSFGGFDSDDNATLFGFRIMPPDTEGDVGLTHYVQWNNLGFKIFLKDGTLLNGPNGDPGNLPWAGSGTSCATENNGDPIVLYDHIAGRWLFSQFDIGPGLQCVAVSDGEDPAGPYTRYAFPISLAGFNDYPKIGLWVTQGGPGYQSTYNITTNEFNGGFIGVAITALDRDAILAAAPAGFVQSVIPFAPDPFGRYAFGLQPGHLEGYTLPPAGMCAPLVMAFDTQTWGDIPSFDGYRHFGICPGFAGGPVYAFEGPFTSVPFQFDADMCGYSACVPQPTGPNLDTLSQFTMYRYAIRYLDVTGDFSGVVSHTVDLGGDLAGAQWVRFGYLNGGGFTVALINDIGQQDEALVDGHHRWMSSVAQDWQGNMAMGYTVASGSKFASVYFAGREWTDPAGTLQDEEVCIDGTGSQTGGSRWGDYSTVSIDPADDCTFWITNEYVETTGSFLWDTQICTFAFPGCGPKPAPVDFIFCRNPNYFICPQKGDKAYTEATIFGTPDLDVNDIDLSTVQVCLASDPSDCTTTPVLTTFFDRGDPNTDLGAFYCAQNPQSGREEYFLNQDGMLDLSIQFKNSDLLDMPGWVCPLNKEEPTGTFIIKGLLNDTTPFSSQPVDDVGIDQLVNQAAKK